MTKHTIIVAASPSKHKTPKAAESSKEQKSRGRSNENKNDVELAERWQENDDRPSRKKWKNAEGNQHAIIPMDAGRLTVAEREKITADVCLFNTRVIKININVSMCQYGDTERIRHFGELKTFR